MRSYFLVRFIFFVLLFTCCKNIKEVHSTGVKGFKLNSLSMEKGIDGDILIGIKNPNSFGFSIYKSEFDVSYGGVYLGKAKLIKRVHINANAEEVYSFRLQNDFKEINLLDATKLLAGSVFKSTIEVKGTLKVGKLFVNKKIPVDIKEKINLN